MTIFLKRLGQFVLFVLVGYPLLLLAWGNLPVKNHLSSNLGYSRAGYGHTLTRVREAQSTQGVDVLFLGSSHAYRGFDTRVFANYGLSAFNLGTSAQTPVHTKLLLDRYLDGLAPKLVVFEVFPRSFTSDGIEATCDLISNEELDSDLLNLAVDQNHVMVYNTLLYTAMMNLVSPRETVLEKRKKGPHTYVSGGYVEMSVRTHTPGPMLPESAVLREEQQDAFEATLEMLDARDIPYLLVFAPITKMHYDAYTDLDAFHEAMRGYGPYVDYNAFFELDDALHFYDSHHLNQRGVERFNEHVAQMLLDPSRFRDVGAPTSFSPGLRASR